MHTNQCEISSLLPNWTPFGSDGLRLGVGIADFGCTAGQAVFKTESTKRKQKRHSSHAQIRVFFYELSV